MSEGQVIITQNDDKLDYVRLDDASTFNITSATAATNTFYIAENIPTTFLDNSTFSVSGSASNDGNYNVNGNATWSGAATLIVVDEAVVNSGASGQIDTIVVRIDTESQSVAGTAIPLIAHTSDTLYIGNDSTFAFVGFLPSQIGIYGVITLEYWNGAWIDKTSDIKIDSTSKFNRRGYFAFDVPGDWALGTYNGQSAYWIRLTVASVDQTATMQHMMLSIEYADARQLVLPREPSGDDDYVRDINGKLKKKDKANIDSKGLSIDCTQQALIMSEIQLLFLWKRGRNELFIEDEAASTPIDPTSDAFYKTYTGRLATLPGNIESPAKMNPEQYVLDFEIDTTTNLSTILGAE